MSVPVFVYQMEISGHLFTLFTTHLFPHVPGTLWMWASASGTFGACVCLVRSHVGRHYRKTVNIVSVTD